MAQWQRTVHLNPEWDAAKDGELPICKLAGVIAARLKAMLPFTEEDIEEARQDLIWEFEALAADETANASDLDGVMESLFDWGDTRLDGQFWNGKKVCWVDTIGNPHPIKAEQAA